MNYNPITLCATPLERGSTCSTTPHTPIGVLVGQWERSTAPPCAAPPFQVAQHGRQMGIG
jgi:hypothetical protein